MSGDEVWDEFAPASAASDYFVELHAQALEKGEGRLGHELQDRIFVYRVIDGKASATEITVAPQNNGKEYIVTGGLQVGEIIVAEGAGLIKEGTEIKSKPAETDTLNTVEGIQ